MAVGNKNGVWQQSALVIIIELLGLASFPQSTNFFIPHGDNLTEVSCGGILFGFHPNQNFIAHNAGSVWLRKQIDLSKPFTTSFTLDMIDDDFTVDGGAFVFQSDSTALGESYHGLGYKGIDRSVAVTFDAQQNANQHDPVFDHVAIQANGDLDHSSPNNLAGPVSIESYYSTTAYPPDPSVTMFHHLITIEWQPSTKTLFVLIDGTLIVSATKDIVQTIFGGNPVVYWGFTGSNTQLTWYPAYSDLDYGHLYFFFGQIFPKFSRLPETDSCLAGPIQFLDNSIYTSGNGADPLSFVQWYWDFGDGTKSTDRNPPPHQYAAAGSYTVKFTITNSSGCTFDTLIKKITLGATPRADFSESPLCTNSDVQFLDKSSATVGAVTGWSWQFDNGTVSNKQNSTAIFSKTGLHSATLAVHTEYACWGDTTKTFVINEKPIVDYTFTKDCLGTVQYESSLLNNVAINSWHWDFGDRHFSQQMNPSHLFNDDSNYITKLWAISGDCASDTIAKTIPINRVHAFAGNDTIAVRNQPIQLNASGGTDYQWSPPDFLSNANISNPVASLTRDQTYYLTAKNPDGCEAKDTIHIKVFDQLDVYVPTAFTPNNDGKNDVLHVIAPGLKELRFFRIFNRLGQLVFETKNPTQGWDGRVNGQLPNTQVFVWVMSGVDYLGSGVERRGVVTLIR
jgi:gliding motility-associated-like protein